MSESRADDLKLPLTVISRIVKDALPAHASVSKEARIALARAAAVFVLNMGTYANEYAMAQKRRTLTTADVLHALKTLECDELEKPVREAVDAWRVQKSQKDEQTRKRKAAKDSEEDADSK